MRYIFFISLLLVVFLSGCVPSSDKEAETRSRIHVNNKLAYTDYYSKTCIEGVTYITGGNSFSVQLDKHSKIVPCEFENHNNVD